MNNLEPDLADKNSMLSLFPNEKENIIKHWEKLTQNPAESRKIIDQLLDRYGIGRVMFRNTRHALIDFPERIIHVTPLSGTDNIKQQLRT